MMVWFILSNTLAFLSLKNDMIEFELKYFITQFFGSSLFLSSVVLDNSIIFFFSIMIKLLMIPFIFWIISSIKWVCLKVLLIFFTLQKIGPLLLFWSFNLKFKNFLFLFILFNLFFSLMNGLLKSHWVDLMVFSSINQASLMIMISKFMKSLFLIYLIVYFLFLTHLILLINQALFKKSMSLSMMFSFVILSGLPPSLVFFFKILILKLFLSYFFFVVLIIFVLIFSGFSYIYMKIFFIFFIESKKSKLMTKKKLVNYMNQLFFLFLLLG